MSISQEDLRALNLHVIEREAVLRWLLAEARWWVDIWTAEAIAHGGGLDWWAGPMPWEPER